MTRCILFKLMRPNNKRSCTFAALAALLSFLALARTISHAAEPDSGKWEKDIAAFEASDKTNPPPRNAILFIGSSSIRMWKTLAQDFSDQNVINRGFGGSEIADSVHFADRIVLPYRPRLIVLYAGGNDIHGGKTPEQVFADFQAFVEKVRSKLPRTRLAYISIAPNPARWAEVERVKSVNQLVADYVKQNPNKLDFIDVFPHLLGTDGLPKADIYLDDRLHMNAKGYELWTGLVRPHLGSAGKQSANAKK